MKTESGTNLTRCVVDASVVVKWFSEEPYTQKALRLLAELGEGAIQIWTPDLLMYEVGNALWKGKKFDQERISAALDILFDSSIDFVPISQVLAISAIHFMLRYNITFYDAIYVALSFSLEVPLISADPKDHRKIEEITVIDLAAL